MRMVYDGWIESNDGRRILCYYWSDTEGEDEYRGGDCLNPDKGNNN